MMLYKQSLDTAGMACRMAMDWTVNALEAAPGLGIETWLLPSPAPPLGGLTWVMVQGSCHSPISCASFCSACCPCHALGSLAEYILSVMSTLLLLPLPFCRQPTKSGASTSDSRCDEETIGLIVAFQIQRLLVMAAKPSQARHSTPWSHLRMVITSNCPREQVC